jgi:hypothetical protein
MVSTEVLQLEAPKIAQKFNILTTEFKATYGWVRWFLNCQQLIYRTTVFRNLVISLRKNGYLLSQIGNPDQDSSVV